MCKSVRLIKSFLILSIFVFGVAGIIGSSSSGGGDDNNGGNNTPQTYTASGTYTYNPSTGELIINIINSDFPGDCGPEAGESDDHDVDTVTATIMVWADDEGEELTWTRDSGNAGDITGTWDIIDEDGNSYQVTFNADKSISIIAEIVYCDDDWEEGEDTPQTHTASGNYWYNSDTGMLVLTFIVSDFNPGCGPEVGDENQNVNSITATTMHWVEDDMTWTRDSGTAGDILGTWDWVDEDGNAYEITFADGFQMSVTAEIVACDAADASGTWDLAFTIDLAGVDTNFHCIPGDTEGDNTRDATIVINETGDSTFTMTIDGNIINGTISGGVYTFAGSWIDPDPDGPYTINISGAFTLISSDSLTGSDEFNGTNGEGDYCTWDETFIGTKQ